MIANRPKGFLLQELPENPNITEERTVKLSGLTLGSYVNTFVRVLLIKSRMKDDELGSRPYVYGIAEDQTFRVPFISYKPYQMFFKDGVFRFENAYVHEFSDHSLLLVLTEYSKITYLPEEPQEKYFWQPKIGSVRRPLGCCRVTLEGTVSKVHRSSGLVKRCERCNRVVFEDSCPSCGEGSLYWSLRISSVLSDETGSINTVFPEYLTCKLLGRPISDILCMAEAPNTVRENDFNVQVFKVKPPDSMVVNEFTVVDPSLFRHRREIIVPDKKHSKVYAPRSVKPPSKQVLDAKEKILRYSNEEDKPLYAMILEKALDLEIRRQTSLPKLHGIYLTEKPVPLYCAGMAKLYLGFELDVIPALDHIKVEFYPTGLIRQSVLDYVRWRRKRGASANAIGNTLLKWKRNVILAPNGTLGSISKVLCIEAGSFEVPALEVSLPEFWKAAHDIDVKPDEKPLLVIKPYVMDVELTYPPSCIFLDEQTLYLKGSVWRFVEYKKSKLKSNISRMVRKIMRNLKVDEWTFETVGTGDLQADAKRMVLNDITAKLLGKKIRAAGSVVQAGGKLYFLPKTVAGVC